MSHRTDKEIQRRELWALFVNHGSKYGWGHPETRRLLTLHEGFTKECAMYARQPVSKSNWAAQVLPQACRSCEATVVANSRQSRSWAAIAVMGNGCSCGQRLQSWAAVVVLGRGCSLV